MKTLPESQSLTMLKLLHEQPQLSQRHLAKSMGVSLGKANYCLKALMRKGFVKFGNFRRNPDKSVYAYLLTRAGMKEKTRITLVFLKAKLSEYEALEEEIHRLRAELNGNNDVIDENSESRSRRCD